MDNVSKALSIWEAKQDAKNESDVLYVDDIITECNRQLDTLYSEMTESEMQKFLAYLD